MGNANKKMSGKRAADDRSSQAGSDEVCPICGGLGLVTRAVPLEHPDFGKAYPCICQRDRLRAEQSARLRKLGNLEAFAGKTFSSFEIDHALLEPAETYLAQVFPDMAQRRKLSLSEEQRRTIKIAAELAYRFAHEPQGWLVFEGNYGTGKTHLAASIANHRLEHGDAVLFVTVPDLLDHLRATFGPSSEVAYDEVFERIRQAPLLLLDDLGAENQTGWAVEKLYQIFNERHRLELPTVITTNRDLAQIEPRIRSRLLDQALSRGVKLHVPDRRSPVMAWAESDLSNLDRYKEMTFDRFDLRVDEGLPDADTQRLQSAVQAAHAFAADPQRWLVLTGRPGTGKTHLAAAIAHELNARGVRTLFVAAPDLLSHLRATFYPGSSVGYDKRMEQIKTAEVLVIDELHIDDRGLSSWARDKLYEILIYRFDYRLPTVITTIQPLSEMDARLRSRVINEAHSTVEAITAPPYSGRPVRRRAANPRATR